MNVFTRIQNILFSPASEWPVIATEPKNGGLLFTTYVMPLVAIGAVARFLGTALLNAPLAGLEVGILNFVLTVLLVAIIGVIASKMAPQFNGRDDIGAALKLVAYSSTPGLLGGIFSILPDIAWLSLLFAVYGIYLTYTGATPMMGVPADRRVPYTAILPGALIVVFLIAIVIADVTLHAGH